jgi:hypothetical protein
MEQRYLLEAKQMMKILSSGIQIPPATKHAIKEICLVQCGVLRTTKVLAITYSGSPFQPLVPKLMAARCNLEPSPHFQAFLQLYLTELDPPYSHL